MSRRFENETELIEAISGLPESMPPQRDLWPGIAGRLEARDKAHDEAPRASHRYWRGSAIAASILVAFTVGILLGRQAPDAGGPAGISNEELSSLAMVGAVQASEREYQAAFQAFTPVGVNPVWLEQQAAQGIESSWSELKEAEIALLTALEEHPDNRFLNEKLMSLRAQQLAFMRQIYMLDQTSRRNT
jgi:hypothetical protein